MYRHLGSTLIQAIAKFGLLRAGAAALLFALFAAVPITQGPGASVAKAHHWPSGCGREGQKPCPLFGPNRHVPSCKPGLVEKPFGKRCTKKPEPIRVVPKPENVSGCGAQGERPCGITRAFPSCEGNLVQHFGRNLCIRNKGDIVNMSRNTLREVGPVLATIGTSVIECGVDAVMSAQNLTSQQKVARIQSLPCWSGILRAARNQGYRTLTIGGAGGAALLVGAEGENGFAFDTEAQRPVTTYHTLALRFGSIGGSAAVTVGLFKKDNRSFGGDAHGASVGFAAVGGGGAAVFFDYGDATLQGAVAVITSGAKFDLAYIRSTTEILPTAFTVIQRPDFPVFVNIYDGSRVEVDQQGNYLMASSGNTASWYRTTRRNDRPHFQKCRGEDGDFTFSPPSGQCALDAGPRYVPFAEHLMLVIQPDENRRVLTRAGIQTYGWSGGPLDTFFSVTGQRTDGTNYQVMTRGNFNETMWVRWQHSGEDWTRWYGYILTSAASQPGHRFDTYRYESETSRDMIDLAADRSRLTFRPGPGSNWSAFTLLPQP